MTTENATGETEKVWLLRGVPVRGIWGSFGWELHATQRGYCPFSSTGYRSCSGQEVSDAMLEARAIEGDKERADAVRAVRRAIAAPTRDGRDGVSCFLSVCMPAERAAALGLFAPDADRATLWPLAIRALTLIIDTPALHPMPRAGGPAWDESHCIKSLQKARALRDALLRAIAGDLSALEYPILGASTYLALPPRAGGEPVFSPLPIDTELGLALPDPIDPADVADPDADECDDVDEDFPSTQPQACSSAAPVVAPAACAQLNLF